MSGASSSRSSLAVSSSVTALAAVGVLLGCGMLLGCSTSPAPAPSPVRPPPLPAPASAAPSAVVSAPVVSPRRPVTTSGEITIAADGISIEGTWLDAPDLARLTTATVQTLDARKRGAWHPHRWRVSLLDVATPRASLVLRQLATRGVLAVDLRVGDGPFTSLQIQAPLLERDRAPTVEIQRSEGADGSKFRAAMRVGAYTSAAVEADTVQEAVASLRPLRPTRCDTIPKGMSKAACERLKGGFAKTVLVISAPWSSARVRDALGAHALHTSETQLAVRFTAWDNACPGCRHGASVTPPNTAVDVVAAHVSYPSKLVQDTLTRVHRCLGRYAPNATDGMLGIKVTSVARTRNFEISHASLLQITSPLRACAIQKIRDAYVSDPVDYTAHWFFALDPNMPPTKPTEKKPRLRGRVSVLGERDALIRRIERDALDAVRDCYGRFLDACAGPGGCCAIEPPGCNAPKKRGTIRLDLEANADGTLDSDGGGSDFGVFPALCSEGEILERVMLDEPFVGTRVIEIEMRP